MTQIVQREKLASILWELHGASMEASSDPSRVNLREVQRLYKEFQNQLPAFWNEDTANIMSTKGGLYKKNNPSTSG